jgi:MtaA/CmuA family methyltransferase
MKSLFTEDKHIKEYMTGYERVARTIRGESCDTIPVVPLIIQQCLEISRIPNSVYTANGEQLAKSQLMALKVYDYDAVYISTDVTIIAQAMGSTVNFPYDATPFYSSRVLKNGIDLSRLKKIRIDPQLDGRMPEILKATATAKRELDRKVYVKTNFDQGPFSIATGLRGDETMYLDIIDNPQGVLDLLELCTEASITYGKAVATAGADGLALGDSPTVLLNRDMYEQFAYPFTKKVVETLRRETGLPVFLHICGNAAHIIDLMAKTGADVLEIDEKCDLAQTYESAGPDITLEGNISPVSVLFRGTPQQVYDASLKCIETARGRRLLLSGGCEIPRKTPDTNIKAMIAAARGQPL